MYLFITSSWQASYVDERVYRALYIRTSKLIFVFIARLHASLIHFITFIRAKEKRAFKIQSLWTGEALDTDVFSLNVKYSKQNMRIVRIFIMISHLLRVN
jgi:hypothetical protein